MQLCTGIVITVTLLFCFVCMYECIGFRTLGKGLDTVIVNTLAFDTLALAALT